MAEPSLQSDEERRSAPPPPRSTFGLGAKLPTIITSTPEMEQARAGLLAEQERSQAAIAPKQAAVESARSDLAGELTKGMPAAPKLRDVPQYQPSQLTSEDLTSFAGIAMALAGLGTKALRGDITVALGAAGKAMQGFSEGNIEQAKLNMEQFQKTMNSVVAENKKMSDEYRAIIENRKLSIEQKQQALRVAAAGRDDEVMLSGLRSGQFKTIFDLESHRINATNQASLRAQQIYATAQAKAQHEETLREMAKLRAATGMGKGADTPSMDDQTAKYLAGMFLEGDRSVFSNLGRGAQGAANVALIKKWVVNNALERGLSPKETAIKLAEFKGLEAAERTAGVRSANVEMAAQEAAQFAPLAISAASAVPRTDFVPLNKMIELVQSNTASPEQRRFVVANRSLITAYSQVMSRSGARTIHDTMEAEKMLLTADGPDAYRAGVEQIMMEIEAARKVPSLVRQDLRKGFREVDGGAGVNLPPQDAIEAELARRGLR